MTKKKINSCKSSESKELVKREYSEEDKERIANYEIRLKKLPPKLKKMKGGSKAMCWLQVTDKKLAEVIMMEAFGTPDSKLQSFLLDQLILTFTGCVSSEGVNHDAIETFANNAISLLQGIAPKDEVEGMLAIQMIGAHNLAMESMKRTMISKQSFEGRKANMAYATKMLRTYTAQVEALKKYRSKGEQKVTVEHVHVNAGGQAIVGNVKTSGGRRGDNEEGK